MAKKPINEKTFLVPNSIRTMAAVHIKIHEDRQEYQMRIADCNNAIKLWGKTDSKEQLQEGVEKLSNLIIAAEKLKDELHKRLLSEFGDDEIG